MQSYMRILERGNDETSLLTLKKVRPPLERTRRPPSPSPCNKRGALELQTLLSDGRKRLIIIKKRNRYF